MKIRTKLQIAFISTSVIVAASILSISYFSMVKHFEQQEGNRLKSNVGHTAKVIDNFMFNRVADFNVLSNNPLFSTSSNEITSQYLLRVVNQYPFYENLFFVNKNGIVLSSSDQKFIGQNILNMEPDIKDEFSKTLSGGNEDVYISDISKYSQKEIEGNSPLDIELLSDVIDINGNFVGVLVGFVNVQAMNELIFDIDDKLFNNENTYLVNDKGLVLISGNKEIEILQLHPDLLQKDLQQKVERGENGFQIYKNSKDIKVILGYADLSEYGTEGVGNWSLLTTAPYNDVMQPIYSMLYKGFFAFLLLISVIIVLIVIFSGTFSKPIVELEKAVSDFGISGKPINLKNYNKDEIGNLYESFNTMTKNLHDLSEKRKHISNLLNESKDQLNNIINNIGDPVFVKDEKSQFLLVNDSCCSFFNLSREEIIGKTLAEDIPQDEMEIFFKIDKQVIDTGIENINEENLTVRDGKTRRISTKKTRFIDSKGNKFLIGTIRDISEIIKAEKARRESEEKFSKVFHSSQVGFSIVNMDQVTVEVNHAMAELVESTREHLIGKTVEEAGVDVMDDAYHEQNNRLLEKMKKNGFLRNETITKTLISGRVNSSLISVEPIEIAGVPHILTSAIDITDKKIAEEELEKHRNNLEELIKIRTEEINSKNEELQRINKLFVGRELKMKELKNIIKELQLKNDN